MTTAGSTGEIVCFIAPGIFRRAASGLCPPSDRPQGGHDSTRRRELSAKLAEIPDDEERLILATGRYIGEGFDDARLDTLFLAMPISWKGTIVQYAGRLHRLHPNKAQVRIFDYVDRAVPMLERMFEKRLRAYRAIGYERGQVPVDVAQPAEELTIDYDKEALRHFNEEG